MADEVEKKSLSDRLDEATTKEQRSTIFYDASPGSTGTSAASLHVFSSDSIVIHGLRSASHRSAALAALALRPRVDSNVFLSTVASCLRDVDSAVFLSAQAVVVDRMGLSEDEIRDTLLPLLRTEPSSLKADSFPELDDGTWLIRATGLLFALRFYDDLEEFFHVLLRPKSNDPLLEMAALELLEQLPRESMRVDQLDALVAKLSTLVENDDPLLGDFALVALAKFKPSEFVKERIASKVDSSPDAAFVALGHALSSDPTLSTSSLEMMRIAMTRYPTPERALTTLARFSTFAPWRAVLDAFGRQEVFSVLLKGLTFDSLEEVRVKALYAARGFVASVVEDNSGARALSAFFSFEGVENAVFLQNPTDTTLIRFEKQNLARDVVESKIDLANSTKTKASQCVRGVRLVEGSKGEIKTKSA